MNPKNADLLKAHVQFEMELMMGDGLKQTLEVEVLALFQWLKGISLKDITSASTVVDTFRRNAIERSVPASVPDFASRCAGRIRETLNRNTVRLEDVLSRELYDRMLENVFKMHGIRNEIISQAVNSTIFSMMIAETLYGGIKAFVSDNALTKNVPGASSLFDLGKGMLNKATFGLSENLAGRLDEQIKEFINSNISSQLKNSEKFLVNAFDQDLIQKSGEEIWQKVNQYDSSSTGQFIEQAHIDAMAPVIGSFWESFRTTPIYFEISSAVIDFFFEAYGDMPIYDLLAEMGVTSEIAVEEANRMLLPALERPVVRAYLEQRIRVRLERFYAQAQ